MGDARDAIGAFTTSVCAKILKAELKKPSMYDALQGDFVVCKNVHGDEYKSVRITEDEGE